MSVRDRRAACIGFGCLVIPFATASCAVPLDASFRPALPTAATSAEAQVERGQLKRLAADPTPPPVVARDRKLGTPIAQTTVGAVLLAVGTPLAVVGFENACSWSEPASGRCFAKAAWPVAGAIGAIVGAILLPVGINRLAHDVPDETTHEPAGAGGRAF